MEEPQMAKKLVHLNMVEDPDLASRPVSVIGVVSSTSTPYLAPSEVEAVWKDKEGDTMRVKRKISRAEKVNMELVGIHEGIKHRRLQRLLSVGKDISVYEKDYRTIYLVRVRPPVYTLEKRGEKIVDERGFEYKAYDIYITADKPITFQPSSLIQLEGTPLPNPKTQRTTLLVYNVEFPEEVQKFNEEDLRKLLNKFRDMSVKDRLNWILENFEKYSQIVGRRNLAETCLITFFTPTWVEFDEEIQRGWGNATIIGDTTTAKSETLRKMIMLLKAGMLITAETASAVGLMGTATQIEKGGWFVDWGSLVLCDRRLLAVDGAQKLSLANWCALAEAERSGVVTISKAAKNSAYARTRQIKIANPVDRTADRFTTKSLAGFLYLCQSIPTFLDKTSIARLDLVAFADQRDVKPEQINVEFKETYDPDLEFLAEALKWCWSSYAKIEFTEEAVQTLLSEATNLYNTYFSQSIPVVSIDMKWKLARLSVALAYLTLSTEDFKTVVVTKDHVDEIVNFIKEEYSKAGLDAIAREEIHEAYTMEEAKQIISGISVLANIERDTVEGVIKFIVHQGRVTRDQLKTQFILTDHHQLRPLLSSLQNEKLLQIGSRGFLPTPQLIQLYKVLTRLTMLPPAEKEGGKKIVEEEDEIQRPLPTLVVSVLSAMSKKFLSELKEKLGPYTEKEVSLTYFTELLRTYEISPSTLLELSRKGVLRTSLTEADIVAEDRECVKIRMEGRS